MEKLYHLAGKAEENYWGFLSNSFLTSGKMQSGGVPLRNLNRHFTCIDEGNHASPDARELRNIVEGRHIAK